MSKGERQNINLEMAQALDDMTRTLSSENADFLERVLKPLKDGKPIGAKDEARLEALYKRYFAEDGTEDDEEDEDDAKESNGDDDIDEDDFV